MIRPYLSLLVIFGILICDQWSKWLVIRFLEWGERVPLFFWLDLTLVYNRGAAFSFLAGSEWANVFFTGFASLAILFIIYWLARAKGQHSPLLRNALRLILAGALGNLIDRLRFGYVIDFISVHYRDWYYPSFNVADAAISIGAVLLIVDFVLTSRQGKIKEPNNQR